MAHTPSRIVYAKTPKEIDKLKRREVPGSSDNPRMQQSRDNKRFSVYCVLFEQRDEEDNDLLDQDVHGPYTSEEVARAQQRRIAYRIIDEYCAEYEAGSKGAVARYRRAFEKALDDWYLDQCQVKVIAMKGDELRQSFLGYDPPKNG